MALTISVVQSCSMCFSEKCLRSAIAFEAERGFRNALGRKMRFNNFLFSKISKLCSRSKHKFAEKLLEEADSYKTATISDRSKLLSKVSVLMGYDGLHDLIENERAQKESSINLKDAVDDFDVTLACKRFPSIILGQSPLVELYDGTACCSEKSSLLAAQICKGFLPSPLGAEWVDPDSLSETWPSLFPSLPNMNSSLLKEERSYSSPLSIQSSTLETEVKSDPQVIKDETFTQADLQNADSVDLILDKAISCTPGLSKRQCRQLENCGFHTLRKLLHHFPRTYADLQNAQIGIDDGQYLIFIGKILASRGIRASRSFSFLEVVVGCEVADGKLTSEHMIDEIDSRDKRTIYLHLKKFFRGTRFTFQPFLKSLQDKHKEGDIVCVSGKVRTMSRKDHYEMREYNLDVLEDEQDSSVRAKGRPYPIYPSKGGLNPNYLRDFISRALQTLPVNVDPVPKDVIQDFGLVCLRDAYIGIHQPKNFNEADLARKRLIFDEFFYLQLGRLFQMLEGLGTQIEKDGLLDKYRKPELNAVFIEEWSSLTKTFLKALPYSLTSSQLSAVSEIIWDLKRPVPMNRLLQGDVGCGKTVVAFLACMEVIGSGYQAAFMVPTELLAVQHYEHLLNLLENMEGVQCKPSVSLLTGSTPSKQSRLIRKGLQSGDISLVIGTHSLIAENVEFSALRIAVVDEQHRFGVIQRGRFNSKLYYNSISSRLAEINSDGSSKSDVHMAPHVLAMSATPIPRTLALALYGDMSLTQITDLPPGRIPVETYIIEGNETGFEKVYQMMLDELEEGGKVYLVYPVIEQSEQLPQLRAAATDFETISSMFEDYSCGLLHGRMKSDEKDEALRRFRSGEIHILLSTQVIEIGVDVPDASMMVVMNAERFGIAQLHQLRGRVGRGVRKSRCILFASTASSLNRLKVLEKSSDGFYLANMDLLLRGPGDLLGKKQSGHLPEFPVARLEIDGNILQEAHLAALKTLGTSHDLEKFPALKAELSMRQPLCLLGD
uniref:DNA 3'-5' helicase n=1 Tax=Davidia involucrata TaxID=16924 RepID=A0A5B7BBQ5_DAVIN